jgi:CspA family cold shock protein
MTEGTVKFFNAMKKFGFINGDDGKSYFVHSSGLKEGTSIKEGDRVSFKAVTGEKGPKAEEVEKLEGKPAEEAEKTEDEPAEEPAEEDED